ncbi:MAG: glycosyltransferase family 39 protein, partial [Acidimicrobiales bacterium]
MVVLFLAIAVRIPTLDEPLVEEHAFRQTQTAYTALLFHEQGVDLLHPKLPVLGAPFEVPFEFPLFQALAAAPMSWGLSPDVAVRTTALACFLLAALLLWGLVRHLGGRTAALVALGAFLFSPFSLLWSRASLIEYLAVAGALGWLWAGLLWRDRRRAVYAVASLVAGLTAMLVKPTTAALWVLPLLAYRAVAERDGWKSWFRARFDLVLAVVVVVPFVAALAWTAHADAIKAANPATKWLTSAWLATWNFGTLDQRLSWGSCTTIGNRVTALLTGYPALLLPLTALVGFRTRNARFWVALVAIPGLTILCFWNLYVVHDYYLAAITPVPAAVAGFGFARAWHAVDRTRIRALLLALLGMCTAGLALLHPSYAMLAYRHASVDRLYPEARELARVSTPEDLVVFEGLDWEPVIPYYARRTGLMLVEETWPATAEGLAADGYRLLLSKRLTGTLAIDLIRSGRWTGV